MAAIFRPSLPTLRISDSPSNSQTFRPSWLTRPWGRKTQFPPLCASPDQIAEKVVESIKNAEAACSDDPASGECVAAWDEVEELSAAASHARDKQKTVDPLEEYCVENPETEECRTYED